MSDHRVSWDNTTRIGQDRDAAFVARTCGQSEALLGLVECMHPPPAMGSICEIQVMPCHSPTPASAASERPLRGGKEKADGGRQSAENIPTYSRYRDSIVCPGSRHRSGCASRDGHPASQTGVE